LEVIEAVKRISGVNFETRITPRRAGDPGWTVASTEKLRSKFVWSPQHNLDAMVRDQLAWERLYS
jgi:UDP-glucose 4-epimerase